MNNPFEYEPSKEMLKAQQELVAHIEKLRRDSSDFRDEVDKGKMFGILITQGATLYAFSGQIADSYDWEGFVPPVFDYLDEDGYFKTHEREISGINDRVFELEHSDEYQQARRRFIDIQKEADEDLESFRRRMNAAKVERDLLRNSGYANDRELIRESQFMKAELHRRKIYWREKLDEQKQKIDSIEADIRLLKLSRQHKSDALQRWLFQQFVFTNYKGEQRSLMDLSYPMTLPPSGAGECCEPKLLNYSYQHGLEPIEMGMFWWGESPRQDVRRHLHFYPACNGKCKPILEFLASPPSPLSHHRGGVNSLEGENLCNSRNSLIRLETVYEDESIIVVNKPAGLLSVPGKGNAPSVFSILQAEHPDCAELQMVHRLDMDTSGLLVVAKTKGVHKALQRQFAEHLIYKEYLALLEYQDVQMPTEGVINLPLRPDYDDRPRQLVDHADGKKAETHFVLIDDKDNNKRVKLIPMTGRTHQLRVHCAHHEGLNNPIKGDRLYGKRDKRLFLHAATLEFTHPVTGERLSFSSSPGF